MRVQPLNRKPIHDGRFVLYWMQQAQRAVANHALEYAIAQANGLRQPVVVCFGLTDGYPEANLRHYTFMLEGLRDVGLALEKRGIVFLLEHGDPAEVALRLGRDASLVICDRGYLAPQKAWRKRLADEARCRVLQVESDVVVPVQVASPKREFAARTLRPKLRQHWPEYLRSAPKVKAQQHSLGLFSSRMDWREPEALAGKLKVDRSVSAVTEHFRGGTIEAEKIFRFFCRELLADYKPTRNQPQTNNVSQMSKYLHFGQISPVWLALEAEKHRAAGAENVASFIDELLVRRELSMNWVEYTRDYERYDSIPDWSRKTLAEHARDPRPYLYSREQIESATTHDRYWNAAMNEMRFTGYMHNHMRMYWGKKILEWTPSPEEGHATALAINNRYFLDGRDANSFANIAWVFGQHDRPWFERPIFGKVRYMNAAGLERKCDIEAYVAKVDRVVARSTR
ncbi:MAG: deoxyribodipyrimidine photo-lyase [Verrucomicrobiota bacterium]|nr:deoxyribodipyrimidine photo-lyase [Verrucomicrobiota bacterium]